MSQENVEIVRADFEAWNAGDMDALRELYDPDGDHADPGGLAGARAFRGSGGGHAPVGATARAPGTPTHVEVISDFIDAGDRVVVRFIWRGAGDGPEANLELTASVPCARARSSTWSSSGITRRPSKPWGCRSKTLTPTPEPAGYCAGDVAGERGDVQALPRGVRTQADMDRPLRELCRPRRRSCGPGGWPEPGAYVGREAVMRDVRATALRPGTPTRFEPIEDFIDAGDRVRREVRLGMARAAAPRRTGGDARSYTLRERQDSS